MSLTISSKVLEEGDTMDSKQPKSFEEAISLTGVGKFHYLMLLGCALCMAIMAIEIFVMPSIVPSLQCEMGINSGQSVLLTSAVYIGLGLGSHMWGFLSDTRGRRKMILFALVMNGICTIVASLMPSFLPFLIIRLINGMLISGLSVAIPFLAEVYTDEERTKALLWMCVSMPLGSVAISGLAWGVLPQPWSAEMPWVNFTSWRVLLVICAIPDLVAFFIFLFLRESPKLLLTLGRKDEALDILRHMFAVNTRKSPDLYPVAALRISSSPSEGAEEEVSPDKQTALQVAKQMWLHTKLLFLPPHLFNTLLSFVVQFGVLFGYFAMYLWMPKLYQRMAAYDVLYPNQPVTFCDAVSAAHHYQIRSEFLYHQSEAVHGDIADLHNNVHAIAVDVGRHPALLANASRLTDASTSVHLTANGSGWIIHGRNELPLGDASAMYGRMEPRLIDDGNSTNTTICKTEVDESALQNTFIIASASVVSFVAIGFVIKYISSKVIIVSLMVAAGACAIGMFFATDPTAIVALPGVVVVISSICYSLFNALLTDMFPTKLRGMAVCMSLAMGRIAASGCSVLIGYLLDENCVAVIAIIVVITIGCGLFSLLLPARSKLISEN